MTNQNESENAYIEELKSLLKDKFFMMLLGISAAIVILSTFYSFIKPGEADKAKVASITNEAAKTSTVKPVDEKNLTDALVTLTPIPNGKAEVAGIEDDIFDSEEPHLGFMDNMRNFLGLNKEAKKDEPSISLNEDSTLSQSELKDAAPTQGAIAENMSAKNEQPTAAPTIEPSIAPTIEAKEAPTDVPTQAPTVTPEQKLAMEPQSSKTESTAGGSEYTVLAGDSIWNIAQKVYGSGFNYVDIVNANAIVNPSKIFVGQKLQLPKVTVRSATSTGTIEVKGYQSWNPNQMQTNYSKAQKGQITSKAATTKNSVNTTHKVMRGETLWSIAQAELGSGFRWGEIAKLNSINNPRSIHSGLVLKLK